MESIKQGANYVAETIQQATAGASKETNKEVAKDSNASLSTRATAAKDAMGDKIDESGHSAKADVHKEAAKN
ncbi:glucose-repressible protein [Fusarium flagelliforme]|uniref:Grg1 protein n=1 Tax=Fusarium flagelliforme TaxID=2675880 RepID=A0A395MH39_9HYPO|nr:glucose-repressible protein [Fusarium flagelliforme]KAH7185435.1 glucose-repressible protein [Fusarium flagelliforme]RFN47161.1 grg1 protein [Fusarium flagelliforme]